MGFGFGFSAFGVMFVLMFGVMLVLFIVTHPTLTVFHGSRS